MLQHALSDVCLVNLLRHTTRTHGKGIKSQNELNFWPALDHFLLNDLHEQALQNNWVYRDYEVVLHIEYVIGDAARMI